FCRPPESTPVPYTTLFRSDDLFDTDYRPIPETDPQQFETRALGVLEEILPPIQEDILQKSPAMVFCAAVDRNGYLPVRNLIYSKDRKSTRLNSSHAKISYA